MDFQELCLVAAYLKIYYTLVCRKKQTHASWSGAAATKPRNFLGLEMTQWPTAERPGCTIWSTKTDVYKFSTVSLFAVRKSTAFPWNLVLCFMVTGDFDKETAKLQFKSSLKHISALGEISPVPLVH